MKLALRLALVALMLAGCQEAGTDVVPQPQDEPEDSPREIRLASADGSQELVLTPAGITIWRQGSARVEIAAGEASTTVMLRDSGGRKRAQLLVTDGPVALSLLGADERDAAVIAGNERDAIGRVELFAGAQPRAGLFVGRDGKGSMTMIGTAMETPTPAPAPAASASPSP